MADQEKTEQPTPQRLREARKRGEVWKSRQATSAAMLLAVAGVLAATGEAALSKLEGAWAIAANAFGGGSSVLVPALVASADLTLSILAPILSAAVVVAASTQLLQVRPLFTTEPLSPKLSRIDPVAGFRRIFSQKNLIELAKSLLIISVVALVIHFTLRGSLRGVVGLARQDAAAAFAAGGALVLRLLLRVGLAMAGIAVLDLVYQRWRFHQDHKMTKHEVKGEYKEAEGDPHQKRERERVHREVVAHGVLEAVRSADVLVVNPTHLAVALRYDADGELEAPEVRAKGRDDLAQRMIRAAEEAGVPVMRDMPLARALFDLEVGVEIPERLFDAVALVLRAAWEERDRVETAEAPGPEARG